jgi:hypothetical protein
LSAPSQVVLNPFDSGDAAAISPLDLLPAYNLAGVLAQFAALAHLNLSVEWDRSRRDRESCSCAGTVPKRATDLLFCRYLALLHLLKKSE